MAVNPLAWAFMGIAALLGYGARPIVRMIGRIPEDSRDKAVVIVKSLSLAAAALALLLATGII